MLSFLLVLKWLLINNLLCEIFHFHADRKLFHVGSFAPELGLKPKQKAIFLYQIFTICLSQM